MFYVSEVNTIDNELTYIYAVDGLLSLHSVHPQGGGVCFWIRQLSSVGHCSRVKDYEIFALSSDTTVP